MTTIHYFTAAWCMPCKTFGPALARWAKGRDVEVITHDIDTPADGDAAAKIGVKSVPTIVIGSLGAPDMILSGSMVSVQSVAQAVRGAR